MEGGMIPRPQNTGASNEVQNNVGVESRPLANFHPDVWGDYFLNYISDDEETKACKEKELKEYKEEVRKELLVIADKSLELLNFIDAIQRLGVGYHFEEEIEDALQKLYDTYKDRNDDMNVYYTSLQFRLLRQRGFHISCDVFKKFMDEEGSFNECIKSDIPGMLSLYEASHLRVHGDETLDKALDFTTVHLKAVATQLSEQPLAAQVLHALKQPLHKGMTRLESRHYIAFYEQDASHNKTLLKFAKLDFNWVQSLHKEELRYFTRWWRSLNAATKLPIRDRVAEGYFWILATFYEPQYALGRFIFMKVFKVVSILDDTYDAYGTIEELELLTKAIERWDYSCLNEIPEYMKLGYQPLLDIFKEFEDLLAKDGRSHCIDYAREEMRILCRAYLMEARWRNQKHSPTLDEYLNEAAIVSFGYKLGVATCYLGIAVANKDAFSWVSEHPKIVHASGVIGRLLDDMASHTFEQARNHVSSGVECCMRQYGVTEEQAQQELNKRVANGWKDVNQAMLRPYIMPRPLLDVVLNLCRAAEIIYKGEDTYTFANHTMKNNIAVILTDPIPI